MAYPHELPDLGYATDALEPHIDARTMEIHHGKHHAGYTNKLNAALEKHPEYQRYSPEQLLRALLTLPEGLQTAVRNNGGGYHNHSLFWEVLTPGGSAAPSGDLASEIDNVFGSLDEFKSAFSSAAAGQFGSGWGWLVVDPFGNLRVTATANQDSPLIEGSTPILGVDVWEHAYYLNYQNRRPDYLDAFWNVVNWDKVAEKYASARKGWIQPV
jgi:superoxide dismutase, Fe-Mn family